MVQASGRSSISFGSMTCSLPILAVTAATLAIFLGVVITPWLGLPLRSTIQSYILEAGFMGNSKNAGYFSDNNSQFVDVANDSTVPTYMSGKNHNTEEIVHPKTADDGISNQSAATPKRTANNGGTAKSESVKQFPLSGKPSISLNSSLQPSEKQSQSTSTQAPSGSHDDSQDKNASTAEISATGKKTEPIVLRPPVSSENGTANVITSGSSTGKCDLFQGKWVHDSLGPLYKNDSCPILTQAQNCQGNGRPDKDYENWRWQPMNCDLPRFDAHKFLELMHGKTLAFVGDSVARNQMESMMCILWQAETPQNKGNRKMQRWFFRSQSVTVIRIWSAWLVHTSSEAFQFAPEGLTKLHLDKIDETFMDYLPTFDVLVISSGHWFTKKAAFLYKDNVVGGQLWWEKGHKRKIENAEAFAIATETALKGVVSHPDYKGLTIFRTFSPDHYEGGAWNTGGSCTGKVRPFTENEVVANGFTDLMKSRQLYAYEEAKKNLKNRSKLILADITSVFAFRGDGHPGPYRSTDPNKITKRGPNGRPPPQDCLHWCMPGPVDTWNEFVFEITRRHLNGSSNDM